MLLGKHHARRTSWIALAVAICGLQASPASAATMTTRAATTTTRAATTTTRAATTATTAATVEPPGGSFTAVPAARLLDTRRDGGIFQVFPGPSRNLRVIGRAGVPTAGVSAVALNLTVLNPKAAGYLVAYPTGTSRPNTWNVTFPVGKSVTGFAIVPVGQDGDVTIYRSADTTYAVDVVGWFSTAATASDRAGLFHPATPGQRIQLLLRPSTTLTMQLAGFGELPSAMSSVLVNLTVTQADADGYLTAYPAGSSMPAVPMVSFARGQPRTNRTIVGLGDGAMSLYNASTGWVTLVLSVTGWFTTAAAAPNAGGAYFVPLPAVRIVDPRNGIGDLGVLWPNHGSAQAAVGRNGVPDGMGTAFPIAVAATLTALNPDAAGYIEATLNGAHPDTDLWFGAHDIVSNTIVVDRHIYLENHSNGFATVLVDLFGYFALPTTPLNLQYIPGSASAQRAIAISRSGRYVVLVSESDDLVPGDTNGSSDAFLWDRMTGTITRANLNSAGEQANGGTSAVAVSDDGRYVAFTSWATNLGRDGDDKDCDLFVRDLVAGTTTQLNTGLDPLAWNHVFADELSLSGDGTKVVFVSAGAGFVANDTNNTTDVFVADTRSRTITRVSVSSEGAQGDLNSGVADERGTAVISGDGRFVAFLARATNLVPNDRNNLPDLFLHDLITHRTTREDVSTEGEGSQTSLDRGTLAGTISISDDGRLLVFTSRADNLAPEDIGILYDPDVYIRDRATATTTRLAPPNGHGSATVAGLSGDGTTIMFLARSFVPDWPAGPVEALCLMRLGTGTVTTLRGQGYMNGGVPGTRINRDGTTAIVYVESVFGADIITL